MSQELDLLLKRHEEIVVEAEKYAAEKKELSEKIDAHQKIIADDQARVAEIYRAPAILIKDVDKQFEKATKLSGVDVGFLFVAIALQVVRQCLVRFVPPERLSDQEAAKRVKNGEHEKSDRMHHYYRPSLEEIITSPVPFDANLGSNGFLAGSPLGHRGATPGHDPLVGLFVGTANIATSTITNWNWASRHVRTGIYGNMKGQREIIAKNAVTKKVFSSAIDKLVSQGHEGKVIIGASVSKELIHLKSDINTKKSLPLPIISAIDPKLAGELAKRGFDMANAVAYTKYYAQQAGYAILINTLVGMIHGLFYDESSGLSRSLYEVRTRRILSFSNAIASTANIIGTAATRDLKYLDVGGMLVTIYRIASDSRYIRKMKIEFLRDELADRIRGSEYDFMGE